MPKQMLVKGPKIPWKEDPTPVSLPTRRSRAEAFLSFINHEHIPYEQYGRELNIFVRDVEYGLTGRTAEAGAEITVHGAGTEGFRAEPTDSGRPTRRGGPYDPVDGGRAAEFKRTGVDPGVFTGSYKQDAIPKGRGSVPDPPG